jgi:glycine reductase complex component B subunit gamma
MAKEIERAGIPVAYVTTLTSLAEENRANRIVAGVRIPHPLGNPALTGENELSLRTAVTRRALGVLTETVSGPKVFHVDQPGAH